MRKLWILAVLLWVAPGMLAAQGEAMLVNPMTEYPSYQAIRQDTDLPLADAPEGASQVGYFSIDGEPFLAEIQFELEGHSYTYRAATAESVQIVESDRQAMHGVYMVQPQSQQRRLEPLGLEYQVDSEGPEGALYTWYVEGLQTQYSLYCPTGSAEEGSDSSRVFQQLVEGVPAGE